MYENKRFKRSLTELLYTHRTVSSGHNKEMKNKKEREGERK